MRPERLADPTAMRRVFALPRPPPHCRLSRILAPMSTSTGSEGLPVGEELALGSREAGLGARGADRAVGPPPQLSASGASMHCRGELSGDETGLQILALVLPVVSITRSSLFFLSCRARLGSLRGGSADEPGSAVDGRPSTDARHPASDMSRGAVPGFGGFSLCSSCSSSLCTALGKPPCAQHSAFCTILSFG